MARTIEELVKAWVRAEWEYRHGPFAYRNEQTATFVKMEERLRRGVAGNGALVEAYNAIREKDKQNLNSPE